MANAKIVIAIHKQYQTPTDDIYLPLQVGAQGKNLDLGFTKDNTGINISEKNPSFCELTALYWAWKNLDSDYIGLVHYRRYFSLRKKGKNPFENILTGSELDTLIPANDVIVPRKRHYYIETLYSHYYHTHYGSQLDATEKIIQRMYPDYLDDYHRAVNKRSGYMFNMMIMRRDLVDQYCSWLFSILFELERQVNEGMLPDCQNLDAFQARFYGRVSEIIFNVWLEHNIRNGQIKHVKELKCIYMEHINWNWKIFSFLRAKFTGKKYKSSF